MLSSKFEHAPPTWKTLFTSQFAASCRLPLVGPPMINVSGGTWAAAIQKAGGMGFIAAGHLMPGDSQIALAQEIANYRKAMASDDGGKTNNENFLALGFIGHSATSNSDEAWKRYEQILDQERPTVVQFFAPAVTYHPTNFQLSNIALAQRYGAKVMAQVGNVEAARLALDAGADVIIVQGAEAGGHGLRPPLGRALIPLLADVQSLVRQDFAHVPVLAAGGITTGASAAATLCAGADGVVLGTRLWASQEALGHAADKHALVEAASCDDVIRTTVVDQIQNSYTKHPWPVPFDSLSVLQNDVTRKWDGRTTELTNALAAVDDAVAQDYQTACSNGKVEQGAVLTGQGVGQIKNIDSVAEIMVRIEEEMIQSIQALSRKVNLMPHES